MIHDVLEKVFHAYYKLSQREQRLALITAIVVLLMLVFMVYQRAQERLNTLDREIMRLEDELLAYTRLMAHRDVIQTQYQAIAAQHSSEWTEAEIHDRLRQEIYRLARNNPPPLDANGIPVSTNGGGGNLVEIPTLGRGQMSEGGQGYREYRINLRIPQTQLRNIVQFLERLHNSPQSLRIDALDLSREPKSELVAASIDISRIVADGAVLPPDVPAVTTDGLGRIALDADAWAGIDATISDAPEAAQSPYGALDIRLTTAAAEVYMQHQLPGGAEYEMIVNMSSTSGDVVMGVGLESDAVLLSPMQQLEGDGETHRYQTQFALPGAGTPVALRCPWIQGNEPDTLVRLSGLMLRKISESYE